MTNIEDEINEGKITNYFSLKVRFIDEVCLWGLILITALAINLFIDKKNQKCHNVLKIDFHWNYFYPIS